MLFRSGFGAPWHGPVESPCQAYRKSPPIILICGHLRSFAFICVHLRSFAFICGSNISRSWLAAVWPCGRAGLGPVRTTGLSRTVRRGDPRRSIPLPPPDVHNVGVLGGFI